MSRFTPPALSSEGGGGQACGCQNCLKLTLGIEFRYNLTYPVYHHHHYQYHHYHDHHCHFHRCLLVIILPEQSKDQALITMADHKGVIE